MFLLNGVTLRPLELEDIDTLYDWDANIELEMITGWGGKRSRATYRHKYEQLLTEPEDDLYLFGIEVEKRLVGSVQLAGIDTTNRHAIIGIVIGEKELWGQGIGSNALHILMDYAFTVRGLERLYAEIYIFNTRSQRLFEKAGFQKEGILRQHEYHNGAFRDIVVCGILRSEFYQRNETMFRLPM